MVCVRTGRLRKLFGSFISSPLLTGHSSKRDVSFYGLATIDARLILLPWPCDYTRKRGKLIERNSVHIVSRRYVCLKSASTWTRLLDTASDAPGECFNLKANALLRRYKH